MNYFQYVWCAEKWETLRKHIIKINNVQKSWRYSLPVFRARHRFYCIWRDRIAFVFRQQKLEMHFHVRALVARIHHSTSLDLTFALELWCRCHTVRLDSITFLIFCWKLWLHAEIVQKDKRPGDVNVSRNLLGEGKFGDNEMKRNER